MEKQILKAIKKFSLMERGDTVTVALSGGADSVALLCVLISLSQALGINVRAAHLNHLIRGEEAFRDEAFVKQLCERLSVNLTVRRIDVPLFAKENGKSLELAAREVRYQFLTEIAGDGLIATAHTASDNLETVLLNLTRGTGLDGLCGIPPKRGIFIRPLILCTRAQIEEYCSKNKISFVTDSTNLSDDYTRNKIRHNIVPVLKEINPSVEISVLRNSTIFREDAEYLEKTANKFLEKSITDKGLCLKEFGMLNISVAKRVIKAFIETQISDSGLENIHIEKAFEIAVSNGKTSLPQDYVLVSSGGYLYLERKNPEKKHFNVNFTEYNDFFSQNEQKINNLLLNSLLNCDKIVGKLVVRTRKAGDSIRLSGRGCTKSLNKLYNEAAIPASLRDSLPVIADDEGIVYAYKIGVSSRCAVNSFTKKAILIEVKEEV